MFRHGDPPSWGWILTRINCYIDGFNLYHSIVDIAKTKSPHANHLKWINLRTLTEKFVKTDEILDEVYYFTAFASHVFDAYKRHEKYISALEHHRVTTVHGQFKKKYPKCKNCKTQYITHEEKESDINIALEILHHAFEDRFDKAFLITADSDLLAIVKKIRSLFPHKEIVLLVPPGRSKHATALKNSVDKWYEIKESHLKQALLPESIVLSNGCTVQRPTEYNPPVA